MNRNLIAVLVVSMSCTDPFKPDFSSHAPEEEELCAASADWLPVTPPLQQFLPLPHPASECSFYRAAWQEFLVALQPDANGRPAVVGYPRIETLFQPRVPVPRGRAFLGDIKQAGGRQILIDQRGNSIFYSMQVNHGYADFIVANGLQTADAITAYPHDPIKSRLTFPPGVSEFKAAWQIVEGDAAEIASQTAGYVSMQTTAPTLSQDPVTGAITADRDVPRAVTVRLLAIHVVFTLPGHPEFIWGTFEHSTGMSRGLTDVTAMDGQRDVAPIIPSDTNPTEDDPTNRNNTTVISQADSILYKANTPANLGNVPKDERELRLEPASQKFLVSDGSLAQTSIYRMFPASKSNTTHPDDAITSLNHNVEVLFATKSQLPGDMRGHYRLVGAQWMDKPRFFVNDSPLQNDATSPFLFDHLEREGDRVTEVPAISLAMLKEELIKDGADSPYSILAGEDRLSSTAIESFTQGPDSFNNCFTCHNTQAVTANGIPLGRDQTGAPLKILDPGLLNVSHIISQFLIEEHQAATKR